MTKSGRERGEGPERERDEIIARLVVCCHQDQIAYPLTPPLPTPPIPSHPSLLPLLPFLSRSGSADAFFSQ